MYYQSQMKTRDWIRRLRAASLLMALLAVPVSASVTLATDSSDVCSMSCCVNEGHCCCSPQRSRVKQLARSDRESIEIAQADQQCPDRCAVLRASTSSLRAPIRGICAVLVEPAGAEIYSFDLPGRHKPVDLASSAPRGPPALS